MSKRKLLQLVEQNFVMGWDDPRMPTICGLRRRGYTPASLRNFAEKVGVAKRNNIIDLGLLEFFVREDLNKNAERRMVVQDPLKVVITTFGDNEEISCINNPENLDAGRRNVPFSQEIYIEKSDFMENPPKKYYRLSPGKEVRLRYSYLIKCEEVIKDENGEIIELRCSHDPESKGGGSSDGRKVKGVIHWVDAASAEKIELRNFDLLFDEENSSTEGVVEEFTELINPNSLVVATAYAEPALKESQVGDKYQFERIGYFCKDKDSTDDKMIFNRTVGLKDSFAKKIQK